MWKKEDQIFQKLQKILLMAHLWTISGKKIFLRKFSCHTQLHVDFKHLSTPIDQFEENFQTAEWTVGRTSRLNVRQTDLIL